MEQHKNPCGRTDSSLASRTMSAAQGSFELQEPLSRAALVARSGVPDTVLTFWLRYKLVRPIKEGGGRGTPLRFEWYEANIAAVMDQLRIIGVRIEGMLSITRVYREAIAYFAELGLNHDEVHALWTMFIIEGNIAETVRELDKYRAFAAAPDFDPKKNPTVAKILADYSDYSVDEEYEAKIKAASREVHGARRVTNKVAEVRLKVTREDFYRHLDPYLTITEQPKPGDPGVHNGHPDEMTYFWRVGDGEDYRFKWGAKAGEAARKDGAVAMIAVDFSPILYRVWNGEEGKDE